jgi:hypothetical protein
MGVIHVLGHGLEHCLLGIGLTTSGIPPITNSDHVWIHSCFLKTNFRGSF